MAWTVAFALLGAMTYSILVAPVLSSWLFSKGVKEWHNPVIHSLTKWYRGAVRKSRSIIDGPNHWCWDGQLSGGDVPHIQRGNWRGISAPSR